MEANWQFGPPESLARLGISYSGAGLEDATPHLHNMVAPLGN